MRQQMKFRSGIITILVVAFFMQAPFGAVEGGVVIQTAQTGDERSVRVQVISKVREWPDKRSRFALVIGVDDYEDSQINGLGGASNDAKALAAALVRYAGFEEDQVISLTTDQPAKERRPTRGNILRLLSNLSTSVPKDGLLLVSFSGHGVQRDGRAYLLSADAQLSGDAGLLEETAVNTEVMRDWIRRSGIKQVILILDSCRNDLVAARGEEQNPLTEAYTRSFIFDTRNRDVTAFATLYATEVGQVAYEFKEKKQGYFTWALVEGLKGGAANDKGEVTLARLVSYLQEVVPKRVLLDLGQEKRQRPFAVIEGYKADELVVAAAAQPLPAITPSVAGTRQEPTLSCKGDTSEEMIKQSWSALSANNFGQALACTGAAIKKWSRQADQQQAKASQSGLCRDIPDPKQLKPYFASYWALADIAIGWFIRGQAFHRQNKWAEAREAYKVVIDKYPCAFAWDPKGWFWRVADAARENYEEIESK